VTDAPRRRFAALGAAALLAASAIAHATGDGGPTPPSLVTVGERSAAVATGFTVSPGRVVTVAHVLEGDSVTVRGADGVARQAAVVRRDATLDLALLAVPGPRPAPAFTPAGPRLLVLRGGEPAALPVRVVREIAANVRAPGDRDVARRPALELTGAVAAGDSGAPVLRDGRLAGVLFARSRHRPGVAYAVDAEALAGLIG
jgi:S1-C subfamily serine protease